MKLKSVKHLLIMKIKTKQIKVNGTKRSDKGEKEPVHINALKQHTRKQCSGRQCSYRKNCLSKDEVNKPLKDLKAKVGSFERQQPLVQNVKML